MKKNNDYWFTIEPYTYVYFQKNEMLFFNTLDGSILKTRNKSVIKLVKDTLSETNLSVSYLSKKKLDENDISAFINELHFLHLRVTFPRPFNNIVGILSPVTGDL